MSNVPEGYFVVGNKLYSKCYACGKMIRVDRFIFGSMHLCVEEPQQQPMLFKQNREVTAKS